MLVRRALADPEDEHFVNDAIGYFMAWYREHKLDNTYVYQGILPALDRLRAGENGAERRMAVLTNKPVGPSQAIVEALGLSKYFFRVYGGNSFATKKPDPLGALTLAEEAGVSPDEVVVVGDSQNDVLAARNAGMWSLGLTYGLAPQTLEITPADVMVDAPEEIADVFETENQVAAARQDNDSMLPSPS